MDEIIKINYDTEQPTVSARDLYEATNERKHVYVLLSQNGNVKIGVSKNVPKRISAIEGASGYRISDYYITEKCSNACKIENMAHKHFRKNRMFGEWFNVDFKEAISVVKRLYKKHSEFVDRSSSAESFTEIIHLLYPPMPFENGEFSDEFINLAIELGEKMKELKMLKEIIGREVK